MKQKSYICDNHDICKIKRCLYTEDYVKEINNPRPAVAYVDLPGEVSLDEQVRRIMSRTLSAKQAQIEKNSVEDIEDAWDFDIPEEEHMKTPFEFAADALEIQSLYDEDQYSLDEAPEENSTSPLDGEDGDTTRQTEQEEKPKHSTS